VTRCTCDETTVDVAPATVVSRERVDRHLAGFAEHRRALLAAVGERSALSGWRARDSADLGLLLVEVSAYVLDVLGFYDEQVARASYVGTAQRRDALRRLAALIGYRPRPGSASSGSLALVLDRPLSAPPSRLAVRSTASGGVPAQCFEGELPPISIARNSWSTAERRTSGPGKELLLEAATARLTRDAIVHLSWPRTLTGPGPYLPAGPTGGPGTAATAIGDTSSAAVHSVIAARVVSAVGEVARDGRTYVKVEASPAPKLTAAPDLRSVVVKSSSLSAATTTFQVLVAEDPQRPWATYPVVNRVRDSLPTTVIHLDAVYSAMRRGDDVVVQRGADLRPARIHSREERNVRIGDSGVELPVSVISVQPQLPATWETRPDLITIHYNMVDGGRLTTVAKTELEHTDFRGPAGMPLVGPLEPIPAGLAPHELLLEDANGRGVHVRGTVEVTADGAGKVVVHDDVPFPHPLRAPVKVYGNLFHVTRGETVAGEVLGSGDAAQVYQSFTLEKKPLTYLPDPSAADGRRSTLEVRVNGLLWREVPSFYGAASTDEVYVVRHDDEGAATVHFGDGVDGARLPTGVDNVVATYRFGAGAAKPPPGAITQLVRPVPGLRRVVDPVGAVGGADADRPRDIRRNAPASALTLGRAVSIEDFDAMARAYGVVNARAEWTWDAGSQNAAVKVWIISDGPSVAGALRQRLVQEAGPAVPIAVAEARPRAARLDLEIEVAPRHDPATVAAAVRTALVDDEAGLLARGNLPIGRPVFRSRLFEAVQRVPGVAAIRGATLDGSDVDYVLRVRDGEYLDVVGGLTINGLGAVK
jgi:predicted phage baseplate assembly protein